MTPPPLRPRRLRQFGSKTIPTKKNEAENKPGGGSKLPSDDVGDPAPGEVPDASPCEEAESADATYRKSTRSQLMSMAIGVMLVTCAIPIAILIPMAWTIPVAVAPFVIRPSWVAVFAPVVICACCSSRSYIVWATAGAWLIKAIDVFEKMAR
jgi:hypothetical protein